MLPRTLELQRGFPQTIFKCKAQSASKRPNSQVVHCFAYTLGPTFQCSLEVQSPLPEIPAPTAPAEQNGRHTSAKPELIGANSIIYERPADLSAVLNGLTSPSCTPTSPRSLTHNGNSNATAHKRRASLADRIGERYESSTPVPPGSDHAENSADKFLNDVALELHGASHARQ